MLIQLVSSLCFPFRSVDSLNPLFQSDCHQFYLISLQRKTEENVIYKVLREKSDDVTRKSTMLHFNNALPSEKQMRLKYLDKEY
jgi:hypothetical protein